MMQPATAVLCVLVQTQGTDLLRAATSKRFLQTKLGGPGPRADARVDAHLPDESRPPARGAAHRFENSAPARLQRKGHDEPAPCPQRVEPNARKVVDAGVDENRIDRTRVVRKAVPGHNFHLSIVRRVRRARRASTLSTSIAMTRPASPTILARIAE